ncbi:MAG: TonB-dependent receptor, partial [Armatimonadota bacterium]
GDRRKDIPTAIYDTEFNQPGVWTDDYRSVMSLCYETKCSAKRNDLLTVQLYNNRYIYHGNYIYDYGYPTLVTEFDYANMNWFGIETRYSVDINPRLSLTSGLEYTHSRMRQEDHDAAPYYQEYANSTDSTDMKSCYTQADLTIADPLRMVVGLRLDKASAFGTNLSPRFAFIYNASQSTTMKMLYGQAFRAPCLNEGYNLDPEEIATTEFVLERALGTHSRLVTSIFHYDLDQVITQATDIDGNIQYVNSAGVTSDGIETQLESRVMDGIDGYLGFSLLRTRDAATDEHISNSPNYLVTAGLSLPMAKKYIISPDLQLVGSEKTLAGNETGSALVCNLTMKTKDSKGLGLSLRIHNLLNKTVYVPGSSRIRMDKIPQEGRTLQIQASYNY